MLYDYTEHIDCKFDDSYPNMLIEKLESTEKVDHHACHCDTINIYMCVCACV